MAQSEVLRWLREQRDNGDDSFYTFAEIYEAVKKENSSIAQRSSVNRQVRALYKHGFLDTNKDLQRYWRVKFRAK